ncbi:hypothetical protein [Paenibacillus xerothermodurans]|uniref:Preprotein translocase subunit Tim44 n=1 Tax=Paenibacillus xerothermodurans TaxID=1977292 RepID=A0A2W1NFQ2_PAEXE|nr:hypothetical protein [Paenibacillus xerothermodurans]PZE21871.1 preprotein translocase subunit Tim44 [Paenibacillus xerothermodurans]
MFKKLSLLMMACAIAFSFSAADVVDAKPKSSYSSSKKSYAPSNSTTQTPNSGIDKNQPNAATKAPGATNPAAATKPGFSAGGFMKGMLVGGLAGLLFGSLFANMGVLGSILGLLVNVMAIMAIIVLAVKLVQFFKNRRKFNDQPRRY